MKALYFAVVLVVGFIALSNINIGVTDSVELQASLAWAQRTLGGIVAISAAILVLLRAAQGETLTQVAPLVVAALVGMLVAGADWSVALSLGITTAVLAGHYWRGRGE